MSTLLAAHRILVVPTAGGVPPDLRVMVDVTCLDRDAGGDSVLTARWTVFDRDRDSLVVREFRLSDPVATPEYAATVVAMNRALADLSRETAEAIKTLPEPAPGG